MFSRVITAGLSGIEAFPVDVEVDIRYTSLPHWSTVGLADSEVRESKERVVSAIKNSGYDFSYRKVVINLAPADQRKEGTAFDLPIALALMMSSEILAPEATADSLCIGELGLTGELRPIRGVLPVAALAREKGFKRLIVPRQNAAEAAIVTGVAVYGFNSLSQTVEFLAGRAEEHAEITRPFGNTHTVRGDGPDFADIHGQHQGKRAIEIAAAGGHNVLLSGPPGSGKTMLASRIPTILPPLTFEESLQTSKIYSVVGQMKRREGLLAERPFRHPHHSVSTSGLIGGGSFPKPGEVSLSHNGVLFLDEISEFQRHVLELLRQPLEDREVTIARANATLTYPANFILVASCNPCPCGYHGHPKIECRCHPMQIQKYRSRLSGPLLDRIDLKIDVPPVPYEEFRGRKSAGENSASVRRRVESARDVQARRCRDGAVVVNAQMSPKQIAAHCALDDPSEKILEAAMEKHHLSARSVSRLLKVSRTIADLACEENIKMEHFLESLQYRHAEGVG